MSYTIQIEKKPNYIHVSVNGSNTLRNVLQYLDEIYMTCVLYKESHVLIEEHLTGPNLDTFDVFEVVIKNFSRARSIGLRLAYIDRKIEHSKRGLKFAENLAHIRGVNVRLFSETDEALTWLLSDIPKN